MDDGECHYGSCLEVAERVTRVCGISRMTAAVTRRTPMLETSSYHVHFQSKTCVVAQVDAQSISGVSVAIRVSRDVRRRCTRAHFREGRDDPPFQARVSAGSNVIIAEVCITGSPGSQSPTFIRVERDQSSTTFTQREKCARACVCPSVRVCTQPRCINARKVARGEFNN